MEWLSHPLILKLLGAAVAVYMGVVLKVLHTIADHTRDLAELKIRVGGIEKTLDNNMSQRLSRIEQLMMGD